MKLFHKDIKTLYCRECGAEVYSNERKCWNCGAKTTNRKVRCIVLTILCILLFISCVNVGEYGDSKYDEGLKDGTEQGKVEGLEEGIDKTTKKYENEIAELNSNHKVELKETKETYYKKGKKDGVKKYKKKLKKRREEKKKQKELERQKQEEQQQQEQQQEEQEEQASSESDDSSDGISLSDVWHQITGSYIPKEEEINDVSAAQLVANFEANQVACKQDCDGKYVRISATVSSIGTTVFGTTYICLEDGDGNIFNDIQCFMYKDQVDKVASCTEGTPVTVVGLLNCGSMSLSIDNARITNF